jgi:dUTP pyrophosphatase
MEQLKFKRITIGASLPNKQKTGDAGFDLTVTSRTISMHFVEYWFGVAVEIPEGYVGLLIPRSSITDTNLFMGNSIGVIDSNFRGELRARFKRDGGGGKMPSVGDRIAQLVVVPLLTFEPVWEKTLSKTERDSLAFGSSGGINDEEK